MNITHEQLLENEKKELYEQMRYHFTVFQICLIRKETERIFRNLIEEYHNDVKAGRIV